MKKILQSCFYSSVFNLLLKTSSERARWTFLGRKLHNQGNTPEKALSLIITTSLASVSVGKDSHPTVIKVVQKYVE